MRQSHHIAWLAEQIWSPHIVRGVAGIHPTHHNTKKREGALPWGCLSYHHYSKGPQTHQSSGQVIPHFYHTHSNFWREDYQLCALLQSIPPWPSPPIPYKVPDMQHGLPLKKWESLTIFRALCLLARWCHLHGWHPAALKLKVWLATPVLGGRSWQAKEDMWGKCPKNIH